MKTCLLIALLLIAVIASPGQAAVDTAAAVSASKQAHQAYLKGDLPTAEHQYKAALQIVGTAVTPLRLQLLCNLASVYRDERKYSESQETFKTALELSQRSKANPQIIANLLRQYAVLLRKTHQSEAATTLEFQAETALHPQVPSLYAPTSPDAGGQTGNHASRISASIDTDIFNMAPPSQSQKPETIAELRAKVDNNPSNELDVFKLATAYRLAKDYDKAIDYYQKISLTSSLVDPAHGGLILCYLQKGMIKEAADECGKSYEFSKRNGPICGACCALFAAAHDWTRYKQLRAELASNFPNDKQSIAMADALAPRATTLDQATPYASSVSQASIGHTESQKNAWDTRWPRVYMPIRVCIPGRVSDGMTFTGSSDAIAESLSSDLIRRAFDEWAQASAGLIQIEYGDDPQKADIVCQWTDNENALHNELAVGVTSKEYRNSGDRRLKYTVNLLYTDKITGKQLSKERFYEVVLHEIGHALGLGHSRYYADIMWPTVHKLPAIGLSQNDRDRIMELYRQD